MTFDIGEAMRHLREGKAVACPPAFSGYLKLSYDRINIYRSARSKPGERLGPWNPRIEAIRSLCWTLYEEPKEYSVEYYLSLDGSYVGSDVIFVEGDVRSFVVSELKKQDLHMYAIVKGNGVNMMFKKRMSKKSK